MICIRGILNHYKLYGKFQKMNDFSAGEPQVLRRQKLQES